MYARRDHFAVLDQRHLGEYVRYHQGLIGRTTKGLTIYLSPALTELLPYLHDLPFNLDFLPQENRCKTCNAEGPRYPSYLPRPRHYQGQGSAHVEQRANRTAVQSANNIAHGAGDGEAGQDPGSGDLRCGYHGQCSGKIGVEDTIVYHCKHFRG